MVIPAILESRLSAITSKIDRVSGILEWVQIDICDGTFVPSTTYASTGREASVGKVISYARKRGLKVELDLMVDFDQSGALTRWTQTLGVTQPDRVVFHLGSTYRWDELFQGLQRMSHSTTLPFPCTLAVRIGHSRKELRKILAHHHAFNSIQIMGISQVGSSGQKLSPEIYTYTRKIRRSFPDLAIQIDGGVKVQHAKALRAAGADRLGMNSGLFDGRDIMETIKEIGA